ncbi:MAG: GNAT family N-acetyltransferase [Kiritimatiellae bacterium]|nr:GNAT family N-acetyltransferase [Kiritimatiellia bacterium]
MTGCKPVTFARLHVEDAERLCGFYNGLSPEAIRTFRPLGTATSVAVCREIARDNTPEHDVRCDILAWREGVIVGWCFLWKLDSPEALFGLAVADACRGQGIGSALARQVMVAAAGRGVRRVVLTVVKDNLVARKIYERLSFTVYGEHIDPGDGLTYLKMAAAIPTAVPSRVGRVSHECNNQPVPTVTPSTMALPPCTTPPLEPP